MTTADAPARSPQSDATEARDGVLELVVHVVSPTPGPAPRTRSPGRAQLLANIRGNLRDDVSLMLLVTLFLAQVADLWTTHVALATGRLQEKNPLFRVLFHSVPGLADVVKLGAIAATVLLAMAVLERPRARGALLLAAGISIIAPISNFLLVAAR